jgi:AcrR family transcriptional regulator
VSTSTGARGRRPGGPDTRGEILDAARALFADRGYRATTIRAVAASAGVDPALVHHYFGSKDDLFLASLSMPVDPRSKVASVFEGGTEGAGERLLETVLGVWDAEEARRPLVALVRRSLGERSEALMREGFLRIVSRAVREGLTAGRGPAPDVDLRAQLVVAQVMGVIVTRYILELEPLASLPRAELVPLVAPSVQRYLDGPLA